jgi:hypothetical protein
MFLRLVGQLDDALKRDRQRAGDVLAGIFSAKVVLEPDESGAFCGPTMASGQLCRCLNLTRRH